ncbi:MAG: hypothetical protein WC834_00080 [Eubacteriales bacterium]
MSFTAQVLAEQAQLRIDDTIISTVPTTDETSFILNCLNDFQDEIVEKMPLVKTSTNITAVADTWTNLPTDFIRIYKYKEDGQEHTYITLAAVEYTGSYNIRTFGSTPQIKFPAAGTYTVMYEYVPTRLIALTGATGTLALHDYIGIVAVDYLAWQRIKTINATAEGVDYIPSERTLEQTYKNNKANKLRKLLKPNNQPETIVDAYGGF